MLHVSGLCCTPSGLCCTLSGLCCTLLRLKPLSLAYAARLVCRRNLIDARGDNRAPPNFGAMPERREVCAPATPALTTPFSQTPPRNTNGRVAG